MEGLGTSQASGWGLLATRARAGEEQDADAGADVPSVWSEPLQQLALALIRAVSLDDVGAAVVAYGTVAVGARWAHVMLLDEVSEAGVSLFGGPAVPSRRPERLVPDAATPWNDALRDHRIVAFPSADALYRAYPRLQRVLALETPGPIVTVPLVALGDGRGAVTFGFDAAASGRAVAAMNEVAALAGRAAARAAVYASELHSAELLQLAYLPARLSPLGNLTFASRYLPAGEPAAVGGDWYDVIPLPGDRVGVVIGDVAGHGLQAAVVMGSLRAGLRAFALVESCPARILARLNHFTCLFKPDAFATVLVAVVDCGEGRLHYARAGHPPPLVVAGDGSTAVLDDGLGPPLGLPGATYEPAEKAFPAGASLVAYTDGLVECRDESLDSRLAALVGAAPDATGSGPEGVCDRLVFELLAGKDLTDDAALLVATRHGPGS